MRVQSLNHTLRDVQKLCALTKVGSVLNDTFVILVIINASFFYISLLCTCYK